MEILSRNPATGVEIARYPVLPRQERDAFLAAAALAQKEWSATGFDRRAELLGRAAELLEAEKDSLARLMAEEMGKPLPQGRAEAEKCAWVCRYYAEHGASFLSPETVDADALRSGVAFPPLGTVLAIMPWNFPLWQVFRFAAPALMAGNGVLLKHAENVTGCARAVGRILTDAGAPGNLLRVLVLDVASVADVIRHPVVRAVTLTGSPRAGREVARIAGESLKKTVLELGGSDPYLILEDADLERAAETCVASRLINSGQSCIAAKRFVVVRSVAEKFTERVVELMRGKKWGDPLGKEEVDLGPLARIDLRETLHGQVKATVVEGARLLLGGERPEGPGAFYPPTVLADVPEDATAAREETFGPVAAVITAKDEQDAIRIANQNPYGLGAAVFTADVERGERIARDEIEAGCCFVNDFVKSDPRLPFGGIKDSGYGRELSSFGIREFVNVKTVVVGK